MAKERQRYSKEFRDQAVGRMRAGERVRLLSWELKVAPSVLYDWLQQSKDHPGGLRYEGEDQRKDREIRELRAQVHSLHAKLGEQEMELDFFQAALRRVGARVPARGNIATSRSGKRSASGLNRKAD